MHFGLTGKIAEGIWQKEFRALLSKIERKTMKIRDSMHFMITRAAQDKEIQENEGASI